jgi:hypothetical protein
MAPKEGVDVETITQAFFQFEVPPEYTISDVHETEEVKGVKLKLVQLKSKDDSGFTMY